MRRPILIASLVAFIAPTIAMADPPAWAPAHGRRAKEAAIYDSRGRYVDPRPISQDERIWRGSDGRYYCRRSNGSTGLVIGAVAGAVVGNQLAGRGDKTLGTVLGAAGGALLGREIDRSHLHCR
ncbi:glycine zipper 2TM domain-containing protein [Phenylobacterium montanum]|uniref:17 kDa surface antigen n=1 Tax=Phenylobacterium montanum TaxID=2823693 RepID=A0A975FWJ2_9CAUL|nr:glycine zipper 2TM domain-containing protein [Caulobacter sp. S6]QUD86451.1 glycine zipper 2TM domain-containing protein [Caulobacter sp. S6]